MPGSTIANTEHIITRLFAEHADLSFIAGDTFSWDPKNVRICYKAALLESNKGLWALLHEIGHARLGHTDYKNDVELLHMEVAAWEMAQTIGNTHDITIDADYIQDALDSYRDWLHVRSTCPKCYERCLQATTHTYRCHNCGTEWHVTRSRLCRPYRKTTKKSLV